MADAVAVKVYPCESPRAVIVLAHGAGVGQNSAFLTGAARCFAEHGIVAATFDFPYITARRHVPDPKPVLEAAWRRAIEEVRRRFEALPLFIGGKSMGGRIASHVAAQGGAGELAGLVFFGYPLHPPSRAQQRRDAHLPQIEEPMLFVQGGRDPFGTAAEIGALLPALRRATLHEIAGGDHSLKVPGRGLSDSLAAAVAVAADWMVGLLSSPKPPRLDTAPDTPPIVHLVSARVRGRVLVREPPFEAAGVMLGFHGYLENAETQLERLAAIPGSEVWTLVSVQALHRVYRGRSDETVASWMTRQDRDEMIADNIAYVNAVVEHFDLGSSERPVVCVGFSQGGAMALRAGVRGAFEAAGIVAVGADVPSDVTAHERERMPPMLVIRGARDEWLTAEKLNPGVAALRARGTDIESLVVDAAHEWTADMSKAAGTFLRRIAPGAGTVADS